jgi:ATP-dependent HslUV protease subunit HslV
MEVSSPSVVPSSGSIPNNSSSGLHLLDLDAEEVAKRAMKIAADICVYTNANWVIETLTMEDSSASQQPSPPTPTDPTTAAVEGTGTTKTDTTSSSTTSNSTDNKP